MVAVTQSPALVSMQIQNRSDQTLLSPRCNYNKVLRYIDNRVWFYDKSLALLRIKQIAVYLENNTTEEVTNRYHTYKTGMFSTSCYIPRLQTKRSKFD